MIDFSVPHNPLENLYKPQLGHLWILTRQSRAQTLVSMPTVTVLSLLQHFAGDPLYTHAPAYHFGGEGEGARVAQVCPRSLPLVGDFYRVFALVLRQHLSHMTLLLLSTLAVLPGFLLGISKAYTALLPLFILEGRGKGLEQLRCTPGLMTLHPGAWGGRVVITSPQHLQPPTIHPNIVAPLAAGLVIGSPGLRIYAMMGSRAGRLFCISL